MTMVTGVMVPQEQPYYQSGQLNGICGGLTGALDVETMMENGFNVPGPTEDQSEVRRIQVQGLGDSRLSGEQNLGLAFDYYPTLQFDLGLLILAVIIGNIGMALAKKKAS